MPHAAVKLAPGVDTNKTPALNEAAISVSQSVRFIYDRNGLGLVQKLGGWTKYISNVLWFGVARAMWAWQDLNNTKWLAVGSDGVSSTVIAYNTNSSLSYDVSPTYSIEQTPPNGASLGITTASASNLITINTSADHNIGDYVYFPTTINVGSLYLYGPYQIASTTSNTYSINVGAAKTITTISRDAGTNVTAVFLSAHGFLPSEVCYLAGVSGADFATGTVTLSSTPSDITTYSVKFTLAGTANANASGGTLTTKVTDGGVPPAFTIISGSSQVAVTLKNHGYSAGGTFNIIYPTSIGSVTLSGLYTVLSTGITQSTFFIDAGTTATFAETLVYENSGTSLIYATTATSGTGATATVTFSGGATLVIGSVVNISGVTPTGYNGSWTVTASSAGSVSFASTVTGSQTVAGTIQNMGIAQNFILGAIATSITDNSVYGGTGTGTYGSGVYGTGATPVGVLGTQLTASDWMFDNWGQILIACPDGGALYYWLPVGSNIKNLSYVPNAPLLNTGVFVAMPQRQVIAFGSSFFNYQDPLLVRWCDVSDFSVWIGTANNQAGSYRIPTGSRIVGGLQGAQQGYIWTDVDVWAMQYVSTPYIYSFNKIGSNCGLIGKKAAGVLAGVVYWMSQNQFFESAGSGPQSIPCSIRDIIFENIYTGSESKIRCITNTHFNEVYWHFAAAMLPVLDGYGYPTGTYTAGNGEVNAYVKYNVILNTWDYCFQTTDVNILVARTAGIDQSLLGNPLGSATASSVPGVSASTIIYQQETGNNADTSALPASFETGYFSIAEGDNKIFVDQVWPDMKWGLPGEAATTSYTPTAFSGDGTTASVQFSPQSIIPVGTSFTIAGASPHEYNGTWIVAASSLGAISFLSTATGSLSVAGSLTVNNGARVFITFMMADYPADIPTVYGPYEMNSTKQYLSVRMRGRLMAIALKSSDINSFWRLGNIRYRFSPDGKF